jgi:Di-haem oxidoreductase, putative peroxidase
MDERKGRVIVAVVLVGLLGISQTIHAQSRAKDPGLRGGVSAGGPVPGLTAAELEMFNVGRDEFSEEEGVSDGVGPRFNFVACAGCHAQPAIGGTSPADNPLFRVIDSADLKFTGNVMPSFITRSGPIREARFQFNPDGSRDGGVHALFVITGHPEAKGCRIEQEDFERQVRNNNVVFRIPTPVFGAGLIESLSDKALVDNLNDNSSAKRNLGIGGRLNRSGNDGTVTRFGWKAQNKSLLIFSGEAYNVEMGITKRGVPAGAR